MAGPEIPTGHLVALEESLAARGIGRIVPLWLRHRAIAVFLVQGEPDGQLDTLAARAAPALELSIRYTDRVNAARHRQRSTAGAELQQVLLPPRISGIRGAELVGTVLPAYDVGGDWFDYAADARGAWLALADAAGKGARASAVSALSVAAFRAARQADAYARRGDRPYGRRRRRVRRCVDVRHLARRALGRRDQDDRVDLARPPACRTGSPPGAGSRTSQDPSSRRSACPTTLRSP